MRLLDGAELVGFIKERQAKQVRALRQSDKIIPKLVIIRTNTHPVVERYMQLKKSYGEDILIEVEVKTIDQNEALATIEACNKDTSIHGIIVQIPLSDPSQTDEVLNAVAPEKDVDGLSQDSNFDPATPVAINWLLAGYNINFAGKHMVIVGHGRLVGKPLAKMWQHSGYDVEVVDKKVTDLKAVTQSADILVCATGVPALITQDMVKENAVIVDAGVATDKNGLVGDVAPDVRELQDISITPEKGGVGPLTVCALFDNIIRAARSAAIKQS